VFPDERSYAVYPTVMCVSRHNNQKILFSEDILLVQYHNGGVLDAVAGDAVSGFHSSHVPNRMFPTEDGEMTGGQAVGRILQQTLLNPPVCSSLAEILLAANAQMAEFAAIHGISRDRPDDLPAIDVAAARVTSDTVEVIQLGDCFAVWQMHSGEIFATKNQAAEFERRLHPYRTRYSGGEFWVHAEQVFRQCRLDLTNKPCSRGGYATLNGQPEVAQCWYRTILTREDIALLLLFTDGLAPPEYLFNSAALGQHMIAAYTQGGWSTVIVAKGGPDNINEGTGLALEFVS
jgi:hypothetical protein